MKKIVLVLLVLLLVGALFGAFDVAFEASSGGKVGQFQLGVVQSVAADTTCERGHHGC